MLKAIIFGGAGFIGSHLARQLLVDGFSVLVADTVKPDVYLPGVDFEYCDVRVPICIPHESAFDVVYNFAAIHRTPGHEPFEYYQTNVTGAQNVVDWCHEGGVGSLVFTSSIAVYGPSEVPRYENSPANPNSDYGRSKLIAETIHRRWQLGGVGRTLRICRPAVVFGAGEQGNFTRLAGALARKRFFYAGRTDTIKSCGYVTDLVRAIRWADARPEPEMTFNYCYPKQYTIEEICAAFTTVAGFSIPHTIPPSLVKIIIGSLHAVNPSDRGSVNSARVKKLTASTNIVPAYLQEHGFEWSTDIVAALQDWQAVSNGDFV